MKILVETSARHIHLSKEDLFKLFGENYKLQKKKELSQPGQFYCEEKVTVRGPKTEINNISVLGPTREQTQVEISLTDARKLGIEGAIRESGDLENTPGCTIVGPYGETKIKEGVIVAKRHIHMDPDSAKSSNLANGDIVKIKIPSENRSLIFDDVIIRVNKNYLPAIHIDTDEANAAGIKCKIFGEIM